MQPLHSRYDPLAVLRAVNQRARRRRLVRYVKWYAFPCLLALLVVLFLASSCCTQPIADSTADLKREFEVYQRAVVPNPAYDEATAAKVRTLGEKIAAHIDALERYARKNAASSESEAETEEEKDHE